ncbi:hypothetical protein LQG66_02770 [Bradyrhizobium ontarionense]|uniref:Cytochrome c domain-containing protein n=1 Tax=Bradyrhizobium ontarionense TaxID=2898149 RepID=A0ABY3RD89_9BRAD|nr:hypothetical protein [Bradyrhizobium sp. A19]UFZ05263.1 hypothetical protein LQG66_02770 [Bradyrhizobium sp. A19]
MVGRALNLAAVVAVFCMGLAAAAVAQENLDAGKSPAQIFNGTCTVCHKSPRGLIKTTSAGSLPGFLKQHYTTSPEMAGVLANYLISNGAADVRSTGHSGKDGKDGKETRSERRARSAATEPSEARPAAADAESAGQTEPGRRSGHHSRRSARSAPADAKPEAGAEVKEPVAGPADGEGRTPATKGRHGKRKKPAQQEGSGPEESRSEPTGATRPEQSRDDSAVRPEASSRSEPPRVEPPKSSEAAPVLRADPVPPVTPAPTTTQSVPQASSSSASDPSVPSSPSH